MLGKTLVTLWTVDTQWRTFHADINCLQIRIQSAMGGQLSSSLNLTRIFFRIHLTDPLAEFPSGLLTQWANSHLANWLGGRIDIHPTGSVGEFGSTLLTQWANWHPLYRLSGRIRIQPTDSVGEFTSSLWTQWREFAPRLLTRGEGVNWYPGYWLSGGISNQPTDSVGEFASRLLIRGGFSNQTTDSVGEIVSRLLTHWANSQPVWGRLDGNSV